MTKDSGGDLIRGVKGEFAASQDTFVNNMKRVQAWDESRVVITKGWFNETASISPVERISFLRLDGDLYSSTWDAITGFYDRVVHGGLIYVDDYGSFNGCRLAIKEFRSQRRIYEPLHFIKEPNGKTEAVWWRKIGDTMSNDLL